MSRRRSAILSLLLTGLLLGPSPCRACNIPVFRYALERWRTVRDDERYQAVVFHRGPLSAGDAGAVARLRKAAEGRGDAANLAVETADVAGTVDESLRQLWREQGNAQLPRLVLRYPAGEDGRRVAWAGSLHDAAVRSLADSPARREIARRLMKGDAVVWVLLESGDRKKDDAAAALLRTQLPRLEKSIQLPDPATDESAKLLSSLPLRLTFSTLRLRRSDPAEAVFTAMLLHSESDLAKSAGPMVFPVFGRGRALDAVVGDGVNADTVQDAARFLCGACSCLVKRLNPGVDLLLSADWDSILDEGEPGALAPGVPQPEAHASGSPRRVPIPTPNGDNKGVRNRFEAAEEKPEKVPDTFFLPAVIAAAALLAAGAGVLAWRARARKGGAT